MRDPKERLRDILKAIAAIERHLDRGRAAFEQDELLQGWVGRVKGERGRVQVRRRPTVSALSGPVSIRRVDHHASLAPPHRTGRAVFPHPALGRVSHAGMRR
jgi:hypothetical protein